MDGREENTAPENLVWACRSCNTTIGIALGRAGVGRLTRQFKPIAEGARSLGQWLTAVLSVKGESDAMDVASAVHMIHATPPERRARFGKEIWRIRRQRGTDRWTAR